MPADASWLRQAQQDALSHWWHSQRGPQNFMPQRYMPAAMPAPVKTYDAEANRWSNANLVSPPMHHQPLYHPALLSSARPLGLHAGGHSVGTAAVQPFGRARRAGIGEDGGDTTGNHVVSLANSASSGLLVERGRGVHGGNTGGYQHDPMSSATTRFAQRFAAGSGEPTLRETRLREREGVRRL